MYAAQLILKNKKSFQNLMRRLQSSIPNFQVKISISSKLGNMISLKSIFHLWLMLEAITTLEVMMKMIYLAKSFEKSNLWFIIFFHFIHNFSTFLNKNTRKHKKEKKILLFSLKEQLLLKEFKFFSYGE